MVDSRNILLTHFMTPQPPFLPPVITVNFQSILYSSPFILMHLINEARIKFFQAQINDRLSLLALSR